MVLIILLFQLANMIYSLLLVVLLSITHCFAFPELSVSRQQVLTHARDVLSNYPLVDG